MKKFINLSLAFALVVVLCQCKKNVETISSVPSGVHITLDVDGGEKVIVDPYYNPTYALVTFEQGDVIYVGNNGAYCGYLTYNGTDKCFEGNIDPTSADDTDYLYFYFLGNKNPGNLSIGATSCMVDISDQTQELPVLSYGRSTNLYNSVLTSYSARLYNKCALVEFDLTNATDNLVQVSDLKTRATIDFATPSIEPQDRTGAITLHMRSGESNKRWAILLPQRSITATVNFQEGVISTKANVPEIKANEFHHGEGAVKIPVPLFSVSANKKVFFSQGNLQYNKNTRVWSFMEHQYSTVETIGQNVGIDYANQDIVSLFGWGTSGWNNGNVYYQPYNTSEVSTSGTGGGYGPTDGSNYELSLTGNYANADWGVFNAISNGGNQPGQWRTLTQPEWLYLFAQNAEQERDGKYGVGIVNSVKGMILLPDGWMPPAGMTTFTSGYDAYANNTYTSEQWAAMESAGAVFLPAAGIRNDVIVYSGAKDAEGVYWTASNYRNHSAYAKLFYPGEPSYNTSLYLLNFRRCGGFSVRLVKDVN